jgi:hypothetical protein
VAGAARSLEPESIGAFHPEVLGRANADRSYASSLMRLGIVSGKEGARSTWLASNTSAEIMTTDNLILLLLKSRVLLNPLCYNTIRR